MTSILEPIYLLGGLGFIKDLDENPIRHFHSIQELRENQKWVANSGTLGDVFLDFVCITEA